MGFSRNVARKLEGFSKASEESREDSLECPRGLAARSTGSISNRRASLIGPKKSPQEESRGGLGSKLKKNKLEGPGKDLLNDPTQQSSTMNSRRFCVSIQTFPLSPLAAAEA